MSILGKILAVLNILGAGGFIALAAMTYAKRASWEFDNFRHDLVVDGLPIDDQDSNKAGIPLVEKFGSEPGKDRTVKELFQGDPIWKQVQEVEHVKAKLDDKLSAESDVRKKNILLARILIPMAGSHSQPEIYLDREFYLSMMTQLEDEKKFEAFKKSISDAIPLAVSAMRFDPKKVSFEQSLQHELVDLPGEEKWKLAETFLAKLPREGVTFDTAAEAAKAAAEGVEKKAELKTEAEKELEEARVAFFRADAKVRANPAPEMKQIASDLNKKMLEAEKKSLDADGAAKLLPDPKIEAAVVFLQKLRKDDSKIEKAGYADYIKTVVDTVVKDALEAVRDDLTKRYDKVANDALVGETTLPDASSEKLTLVRDSRRLAIARFLLGAMDVVNEEESAKVQSGDVETAAYKRFIAVVGLKSAADAVNAQQIVLAEAMSDLNKRIDAERDAFRRHHNEAILSLRGRAEELQKLDERRKEIGKEADKQAVIVKNEKDRVEIYIKDLEVSRGETGKEMELLVRLTDGLNQVRIAIRNAIRNNEMNLRRIEALEAEVVSLENELATKIKADKEKKRRKTTP